MAVTTTNLGVITAYGDAVAAGYTGTKAEWQALMASYATVGQQAVDAKNDAVAAKNTAVAKATEATTAANTATTKASEASASAQSIAESAAQIQENTDDIDQLKSDFTALPYSVYNANDVTDDKYLNSLGEEISVIGWSISDYLPISGYAEYYIKTRTESSAVFCWYYDSSKNPISSFQTTIAGYNSLIAVKNAKYVRFSIHTDETADFKYSAPLAIPTKEKSVSANLIKSTELRSTFRSDIINGQYFNQYGDVQNSSSWARTPLYPVDSGDIVTLYNIKYQYLNYFDTNKHYVSSEAGREGNVSHVVPDGVAYIGCNILATNIETFNCLVNGIPLGSVYSINWLDSGSASIWKDKQYISHGDSITWQDKRAYVQGEHIGEIARGYQTVFSESVGLGGYANLGQSGWSMGIVNGNGIVNTIKGVSNYSIYDLCTIACGTNDFKLNVPIGTLGVIGDTTFDDSTFYGAFRDAIEYILTSSPTIRIVLLTPLQRDNAGYDVNYTNSAGHKLIDYVNAIKAIGEMYGLPVCDMYGNSGFTKKTLSTYTMDGLHPNDVGYQRMGNYLTGFLNTVGN